MQKRIQRIGALVWKEFDFMSKDLTSIGVLFLIPVVIIWIAAIADVATLFATDPQPIWIIDNDGSETSQNLVNFFRNQSENFIVTKDSYSENISTELAREIIPTDTLAACIIIPRGFEDDLSVNGSTKIQILLDGLDTQTSMSVKGQITGALVEFQFSQLESLTLEAEIFFFPVFVPDPPEDVLQAGAPGILAFALFASINLICSQAIIGDVPLKRILVAPTRRWEVIVAKVIAYSALAFFQALSSLFLVEFFFGAFFRGVFIDIFVMVFMIEFAGVCLGIFFSTISSSRLSAAQLFLLYYIISMLFQMRIRLAFLLPFLPPEQGMNGLVNIAYRGQSILENLDIIFNLGLVALIGFSLSIYWFQFKKKEL